jgi:hypothetical protein
MFVKCAAVVALLIPLSTGAANLVYGETLEQTAKRTGYTVDELKGYFPPVEVKYRLDGLAKDRFKAPPKPLTHPRIFFNPEDVPALRSGLKETTLGRRI